MCKLHTAVGSASLNYLKKQSDTQEHQINLSACEMINRRVQTKT